MDLGIDLGTANTVVSDVRRGIVFDEPSVMLLRQGGGRRDQVLAVGREAADLLGRAPSAFVAVRPMQRRRGDRSGDGPVVPARGAAEGGPAGRWLPGPRRDRGAGRLVRAGAPGARSRPRRRRASAR